MAESAVPTRTLPVVLASASPRRRELLRHLVADFESVTPDVDEAALEESPAECAERLALCKARKGLTMRPGSLVIGGDTVVWLPGLGFLGKPLDEEEAVRALMALSGKEHSVFTGVALVWPEGERSFVVESRVTFRDFDESVAWAFVATGEAMDKAGAYSYQGAGANLVAGVVGSESNVIGLPLERLREVLGEIRSG